MARKPTWIAMERTEIQGLPLPFFAIERILGGSFHVEVWSISGLALTLGVCQSQEKEVSKSKAAEMSRQQNEKMEATILLEGNWKPEIHQRLQKLIEEHGIKSSAYDKDQKPYAVFDWDNTTVINDIGEATLLSNWAFGF